MLLLLASTCLVMLNIFIAQLSTCYDSETKLAKRSFQSHLAATIARYERGEDLTSFGCFRVSIYSVHCIIVLIVQATITFCRQFAKN